VSTSLDIAREFRDLADNVHGDLVDDVTNSYWFVFCITADIAMKCTYCNELRSVSCVTHISDHGWR